MTWAIFRDAHIRAIAEIIQSGNDIVTAILGGTLLDDTIQRTLSERLRNDKDIVRKILKPNGALGNTGAKIDLLYLLNAVGDDTHKALLGISTIRNFIAHNLNANFETNAKDMTDAMKLLKLHVGRIYYPHQIYDGNTTTKIERVQTNRELFIVNLRLCLIDLMRDRVSHKMWTNISRTKKEMSEERRRWKEHDKRTKTVIYVASAITDRPR